MVKAGVKNNEGKPVIILGLSKKNVELLQKGKPILINLEPFGMEGQAILTYGETEAAITKELSKVFTLPS